ADPLAGPASPLGAAVRRDCRVAGAGRLQDGVGRTCARCLDRRDCAVRGSGLGGPDLDSAGRAREAPGARGAGRDHLPVDGRDRGPRDGGGDHRRRQPAGVERDPRRGAAAVEPGPRGSLLEGAHACIREHAARLAGRVRLARHTRDRRACPANRHTRSRPRPRPAVCRDTGRPTAQRLRHLSLRAGHPKTHRPGDTTVKPTEPSSQPSAEVQRQHAEQEFAGELAALAAADDRARPPNWKLSPWAVRTYVLGGKLADGFQIKPKYVGNARLIEIAVATLATDRALLLLGVPGTAKSWVAEHLAAAISGDSTLLVQGTAGTDENALRYGWNYARLLAEGPIPAALVPSPMMKALEAGKIARVEELTRVPSEVQDSLISILSEKTLPIPELGLEVQARRGFNVIATANNRDKGVNDLSSALLRRFNTVVLPLPDSVEDEVAIVSQRVAEMGRALALPAEA